VYMYRVKAINVVGPSTTSSAYIGPIAVDMTIGVPTNLTANVTASQVQLSWIDNSPRETNFLVFRSADGGVNWTQAGTATALAGTGGVRTFNDNALALVPGATYQYYVVARWSYNATSYLSPRSGTAMAQILPLPAPTGLAGGITTAAGVPRVTLTWTDNASNETGFEVQRSSDGGATWLPAPVAVAARNGTGTVTFNDTTVVAGNTYLYQVTAVNVTGAVTTRSQPSNAVSIPFMAPAVPTNVAATAGATGSRTITVSWNAVAGASSYAIQRARTDNTTTPTFAAWRTVTSTAATTYSSADTGLTAGRRYQYQVNAINAVGASVFVQTLEVAVP